MSKAYPVSNAGTAAIANASSGAGKWSIATISLGVGVIGIAIALIGLILGVTGEGNPRWVLSYLIGGVYWLSILLGMMLFVMLTYIFDAGWAVILRRQMEHALAGIKWMGLVFLPLAIVILIFPDGGDGVTLEKLPWLWMDSDNVVVGGNTVANDPLYVHKASYLNVPFFLLRGVVIFALWIFMAGRLRKLSYDLDATGDARHHRMAYRWSAFGVIAVSLAMTFFAFDWIKSLEYHWFSTMFGVWFFAASFRAALGILAVLAGVLAIKGYLKGLYKPNHAYLLGCLMLAFTVFWAYISFSQYFLQYSANIPEEVYWYNIRLYDHGEFWTSRWFYVGLSLVFLYFGVPFIYLLWYPAKFGWKLVFIGAWTSLFHLVDLYWNILPQKLFDPVEGYYVRNFTVNLFDIAAVLGVGGLLLWVFLKEAANRKPIPVRDPRILEAIESHE